MLTALYLSLFAFAVYFEITPRYNTTCITKKAAIGLIAVGALTSLSSPNYLIHVGVLLFFVAEFVGAHKHRKMP